MSIPDVSGRTDICADLDLLRVLGGKPSTAEGTEMIRSHEASCKWCDRRGRFQDLLQIMIARTPEHIAQLEAIFGPCNWADNS